MLSSSADCGARRRAVELVGQHDVREHRARPEGELARALVEHAHARDVARQHVRRELDARERAVERARQRTRQRRLADARHVLDEHVPLGQQRHHGALDDRGLATHCTPHVRDHAQRRVARELEPLRFGECGLHPTHRTSARAICPPSPTAEAAARGRARRPRSRASAPAPRASPPSAATSDDLVVVDVEADVAARDVVQHDQVDALAHALGLARARRRRRPRRRSRRAPGPAGGAPPARPARRPSARARATRRRCARACRPGSAPAGSRRRRPPSARHRPNRRAPGPRARAPR